MQIKVNWEVVKNPYPTHCVVCGKALTQMLRVYDLGPWTWADIAEEVQGKPVLIPSRNAYVGWCPECYLKEEK